MMTELYREHEPREVAHQWTPVTQPDPDAPCRHEWRQYMGPVDAAAILDRMPVVFGTKTSTLVLIPDGYFCIHCMERSEERTE